MGTQPASWNAALTSARRGIHSGQQQLARAARGIADAALDLQQGDPTAAPRLVEDIVDLSKAALSIRTNVAVVRADKEIGDEILNLVPAGRGTRGRARLARPLTVSSSNLDLRV